MSVVSFDFDDTLCAFIPGAWLGSAPCAIIRYLELLKEYAALGCKCYILTARSPNERNMGEINRFIRHWGVQDCVHDIIFTSHEPKGPVAHQYGIQLHYDDSDEHLESVREFGIKAIKAEIPNDDD